MPKTRKFRRLSPALRTVLTAPAMVGVCGFLALTGRIDAGQPINQSNKVKMSLPQEGEDVQSNVFVFHSDPLTPSYSAPQARAIPTAESTGAVRSSSAGSRSRAAASEEGTVTRKKASTASTTTTTKKGKSTEHETATKKHSEAVATDKDVKAVVEEPSPWTITGNGGYFSRYMFRGLDVGSRTAAEPGNDSAFFGSNATVTYKGFSLGAGYIQSLDPYTPKGALFSGFGDRNDPKTFRSAPRERYKEYDLFASYTYQITKTLSASAGMNFYWFGDGRSWANDAGRVSSTEEFAASINWTGIPYLSQTLNYYYDIDAFPGSYLEYKLALKPFKVYEQGDFTISLVPSALVSYDFRYNGDNEGWNSFELGIDVPFKIADGLTFNVGAHYNWDLDDSDSRGNKRTDDRFWITAGFQYVFPNASWNHTLDYSGKDKDGKSKIVMPEPELKWQISAGAGIRSLSGDFHLRQSNTFRYARDRFTDPSRLDENINIIFNDGALLTGYQDGSTEYLVTNPGQQINDQGPGKNRQVTFHDSLGYSREDTFSVSRRSRDDDESVFPYITGARELFRSDKVSVNLGVGYQYVRSEMDSGYRTTGQSVGYSFASTYDLDSLTGGRLLIELPENYQATYGGGLASTQFRREANEAVVAFKHATLDANLHAVSLPIGIKYDVTPRIHAVVAFGPTFNFLDAEMATDTEYQAIALDDSRGLDAHTSPASQPPGPKIPVVGAGAGGPIRTGQQTAPLIDAGSNRAAATLNPRERPGKTIAREKARTRDQEFQVGVFGQVGLEIDLDAAKRWYVEVFGRYDYVPEFGIADNASMVNIDATSFNGGVGIGFRF